MELLRRGELVTGVILAVVGLLVVRRRRLLPGALVTEVGRGRGQDVDARDVGYAGSGLGAWAWPSTWGR